MANEIRSSIDYKIQNNSEYWTELADQRRGVYGTFVKILKKNNFFYGGEKVLDIGCGPGFLLSHLKNEFPNLNLFGIDISATMINYAQAESTGINKQNFSIVDITKNSRYQNSFDRIISYASLYLWEDKISGLNNVKSLLNSNARVCFVHPNKMMSKKYFDSMPMGLEHKKVLSYAIEGGFTKDEIVDLYSRVGINKFQLSYNGYFQNEKEIDERLMKRTPFFYSMWEL